MYRSVEYVSSNEHGEPEVEIVYKNGLLRSLFKLPEIKQVFVGSGTVWRDKATGKRAGTHKESEICDVVFSLKYRD